MIPPSPHKLSVVVMTYNEEANIARCLTSVQGVGDEIFVLDSFSTDRTVEIALSFGARVEQHAFGSYVEQKKRLVEKAAYDWVFCIDADEYLSPALRASVEKVIARQDKDGYYNNRFNRIGERWIRHGSWYPDRKIRLFDRTQVFITGQDPHDVMSPKEGARIGYLEGDLLHHADANLSGRFQTIEKHSTRAAQALYAKGKRSGWLKIWVKPCIRFFVSYVIRQGFRDGFYGYAIAKSEAQYVWMREVKLKELEISSRDEHIGVHKNI